jgi:hypothetical protein
MKILKFVLPLATIALLCSFAFSNLNHKKNNEASEKFAYKKPVAKKQPVDPVYKKFIEKFDKVELPYSIKFEKNRSNQDRTDLKKYGSQNESDFLGSSFAVILPEIKDGMMSRMGPDDFMAEALIQSGEKFDVVVYSRSAGFRSYKRFYAATFNKKGKMLAKQLIAEQNYEYITDFVISKDLEINVEKTRLTRNYNVDNHETSLNYKKPILNTYVITELGEIEMKNAPGSQDIGNNYTKK